MSLIDIIKKSDGIRDSDDTQRKITQFEYKHAMSFKDALNRIVYTIWDVITIDEYYDGKSNVVCEKRKENLHNLLESQKTNMVREIKTKKLYNFQECLAYFQECLDNGEEGCIIKSPDCIWKDGKPVNQCKMKKEITVDLRITGFNMGTGKNINVVSSLDCHSEDGKLFTKPTGIDEEMMLDITNRRDELLNTIVEVKCSGLSWDKSGSFSLLHPVFKFLRIGDKDTANTIQEIIEIDKMATFL